MRLLLHHTGVVADEQHSEQCSGNLAQPAETTEDEKRRRYESEHGHHRYLPAEDVAEKVAEHIGSVAGGEVTEKMTDASPRRRSAVDVVYGIGNTAYSVTGRADGVADGSDGAMSYICTMKEI